MKGLISIVRHAARSLAFAGALVVSSLATHADGYITTRVCMLRGLEEVPSNNSPAIGAGKFTIDTDANIVQYRIVVGGLTSMETAAHIHGASGPGVNSGVLHTLPAGAVKIGSWNYPESQEANLLNGLMYVNVHTTTFPGGEVRGQIVTHVAGLDSAQEAPPNTSTAQGWAVCMIDRAANTLSYHVVFSGLSSAETAAHIHGTAIHGQNAGVLVNLPPGSPKIGVWNYPEGLEESILDGMMYFNIHTVSNPGGEIRGQIVASVNPIDGQQEVPPNGSTTAGVTLMSLNRPSAILGVDVRRSNFVTTETAAHIHGFAPMGVNAGILLTLPTTQRKLAQWNYGPANQANIDNGLTYVNIHTTAFGGGEIRGQIMPQQIAIPPTLLTRAQAAAALLAPASGVPIDLAVSNVWCPPTNFGGGPGYEGLMMIGTQVRPGNSTGGTGTTIASPSYLFWIDDLTDAEFAHPTRFALMDATNPAPTVSNGGIRLTDEDWWPIVQPPLGSATHYFRLLNDVATINPAGPSNEKGLIAGSTIAPADIVAPPAPAPGGANNNKWGLILIGDDREDFQNDAERHKNDLRRQGCPNGNITTHGVGGALTKRQFCDAIDNWAMMLMNLPTPCEKLFLRISTHGTRPNAMGGGRGISVKDDPATPEVDDHITAAELCEKIRKLAKGGVPICIVINACFSGGLVDASRWDLPAGSSIITSANGSRSSYGGAYNDGTTRFTGSAFQYALTKCGMDNAADTDMSGMVDDCEAYDWVRAQTPCYTWKGNGTMTYPGGRPAGTPETKPDPNPQKFVVGVSGRSMNYNARNMTGANKTDFHMIFRGDVRGGTQRSWRSNAMDQIGAPWSNNDMISYDPVKDETMVCWENLGSPVLPNQYIHFGYFGAGKKLKPARQWWTPTPPVPAPADRVPASDSTGRKEGESTVIRIINRAIDAGGWGDPILIQPSVAWSPVEIPLDNLTLGDPMVSSLLFIPLLPSTLQGDGAIEFVIPDGMHIPSDHVIVRTDVSWPSNPNTVMQLEQLNLSSSAPLCYGTCVADFDDGSGTGNPDGGVSIEDLLYYLALFDSGDVCADVDDGSSTGTQDGGVSIEDLLYYLFRFDAGC